MFATAMSAAGTLTKGVNPSRSKPAFGVPCAICRFVVQIDAVTPADLERADFRTEVLDLWRRYGGLLNEFPAIEAVSS